ncbi:MAG: hypothetical protein KIT14_25045 [bacterium]|nr:hypothetical protein [bacterium]
MSRRWASLAEARARELLEGAIGGPALVRETATGFGCRLPRLDGNGPFAAVVDCARPEEPDDHARRLATLLGACAPVATVALVACGGDAGALPGAGPRTLPQVETTLAAAGFRVVRRTPFDLLGLCSPWRRLLGAETRRVLDELDLHLGHPAVRAAVRLVERHVTAALDPSQAARVLVVGVRGDVVQFAETPRGLAAPALHESARVLIHDDAVVRALAFVDAELLALPGVDLDLVGWLRGLAMDPAGEAALRALLRARKRWWQPELEAQRLHEAATHRLARRAIAALGPGPAELPDLGETLEYDLVAAFGEALDRCIREEL